MNPVKTVTTFKCVEEFTRAIEVLGRTVFEIEKMYGIQLPILMNEETLIVEVESTLATVCCLLDQNLRCVMSCLFCGDDDDLIGCVVYCNSNYAILRSNRWALRNCDINHISGEEPCLIFIPKNRQRIQADSNNRDYFC